MDNFEIINTTNLKGKKFACFFITYVVFDAEIEKRGSLSSSIEITNIRDEILLKAFSDWIDHIVMNLKNEHNKEVRLENVKLIR